MPSDDTVSRTLRDTPDPPVLLLLSDDLMFPSRIREGVKPLGYTLRVVATEAALLSALADATPPSALLMNLTARRYDPFRLIAAVKANPATALIPLLAFAGHVETDKHDAARKAGADMVVANSSVSLHLAALLPRLLRGGSVFTEEAAHDNEEA